METITQEELKEYLKYDEHTGEFTWIKARRGVQVGNKAGCVDFFGRLVIGFKGKNYYAHRLAFLYMTGHFPRGVVDHIDMDQLNNRWCNLRDVCRSVNGQNRREPSKTKNRTSKYLGVSWDKAKKMYRANINVHKKGQIFLGYFKDEKEAYEAYLTKKREIHEGNTI